MGRNLLTHGQYKQMVGRAGRAGLDTFGESFLMLKDSPKVQNIAQEVVAATVEHCISSLHNSEGRGLPNLILNCLHLGLVTTPGQVNQLLSLSLLAAQASKLSVEVSKLAGAALQGLLSRGLVVPSEEGDATQQIVDSTTVIKPSRLGRAVVAGNIDLGWTEQLYRDLKDARPGLAVDTSLHLLFLITPYDLADQVFYDPATFHHIFLALKPAEVAVCRNLGVTEGVMVKLLCGGSIKKALKPILSRLFCALILLALWQADSVHEVAQRFQVDFTFTNTILITALACMVNTKHQVARGQVQGLMSGAASFGSSVLHFCQELEEFWAYQVFIRLKTLCHTLEMLAFPGSAI